MNKSLVALALLALVPTVQAADDNEQLAREKARAAVMAAEDGNLKHRILEEPSRRYYDWGAVLNKDFQVMALTPGSDAALMGVKKQDKILSINGKLTERRDLKEVLAQLNDLDEGDFINVLVSRGDDKLTLSSKVHVQVMPAWRLEIQPNSSEPKEATAQGSCGRVSVFFTPPQARDLYPAYVNKIDGEGVLRTRDTFKLTPGEHSIELHELIQDFRLTRRGGGLQMAKPIKLQVEANTVYYMAAKFIPEKRFDTFKDGFWEPVVWKVAPKTCD
ncbi:PDZ domain-containing protein [Gallaecimonas xiamenensis]|uniref:PDZ domain-containing protein n=1 Tax=Gallaecimonas xiamenensis 3-C-1 TaxID=745411 RepID=K2JQ33_9GAMM|nr:PDZ domain-containing protein [Gallaecimonas xiamenensis]EKE77393.1 hypothetical protein B3C1_01240 [Gallaecimonas xiamenensis 3-C-1]